MLRGILMKASTKHDLVMIGIGAAVGAVALFVVAKTYPTLIIPTGARYPGFGVQGTVCPSCTTYSF